MSNNLVIVESPAKAKTIEKYLGKDYTVKSSFGHIRDLPKKGISIDVAHNFEPTYEIPADKKKVISELKKAAKGHTVWLASDEDREGEAIAWHLCEALNLDPKTTKRIVFHEITKPAIENAIQNPRTVDAALFHAQQARRVLDRLVGYELSPVLWKKVRPGLSAGRVQSVAVRLIVEREREIKEFESTGSFKITAIFPVKGTDLPAELPDKLQTKALAKKFLQDCHKANFSVAKVETKPGSRNPSAPFTTSTLQQEAARKLGYSVKQTMTLAQRLYESGKITYMRTDSTTLSSQALSAAKDFITKNYGANYHTLRQYKTKSEVAQEAHEAIRPTAFTTEKAGKDAQQEKLYKLIWQRALASQMAAAAVDKTELWIDISTRKEQLLAKGEVLKFDGFMKVYGGTKEDIILPPLKSGDKLSLKEMRAAEVFSKPPARYSEASLVRKLEELGIGRPSTYAPTISTIQTRGYIEKADIQAKTREAQQLLLTAKGITEETTQENYGGDNAKLLPTPMADVTTDFLTKHFSDIVDFDFTARAEEDFDEIADGKKKWVAVIEEFYKGFHPLVEKSDKISREDSMQSRELGTDPETKRPVFARYGRYGPMLQRGEAEDEEKPDFAPLPEGSTLDDITLKDALPMFKLPRTVGKTTDGQEIIADIGRFGPYIKVDKLFVSIKPQDPMKISEAEARKLYTAKLKKEKEKHILTFNDGLQVLKGPYGPYITNGKKNARVPKDQDPKKLTEKQAQKILSEAPDKKRHFRRTANPS